MAGLSDQDKRTIAEHLAAARDAQGNAAYTADDIAMTIYEMDTAAGAPRPLTEQPTGAQGLAGTRSAAMFAGPAIGGSLASAAASRLSPLAQTGAEALGTAAGDVIGRFVAGQPQNPAESLITGGIAGTIGGVYRGGTKFIGGVGGVPRVLTQEAGVPTVRPRIPRTNVEIPMGAEPTIGQTDVPIGVPWPPIGKVTLPRPHNIGQVMAGVSDEANSLAPRVTSAIKKLRSVLTPERVQKINLLKRAGMVDTTPVVDALINKIPTNPLDDASVAFKSRLENTTDRLIMEASSSGGKVSAVRMDEIIREELSPKIYTKSGQVADTKVALAYADAEEAAKDALDSAIPKKLRPLNKRISERLRLADRAERLFGGDKQSSINNLYNAYTPNNEKAAEALKFLSDTADKRLARQAISLATRRAFAGDIRGVPQVGAGGAITSEIRTPARQIARIMAPFQAFVGPTAAPFAAPYVTPYVKDKSQSAYEAFLAAINPMANP